MAVFDEEMQRRLMAYQEAHGIPVSRTVTTDVWQALCVESGPQQKPRNEVKQDVQVIDDDGAVEMTSGVIEGASQTEMPDQNIADFPTIKKLTSYAETEEGFAKFLKDETGLDVLAMIKQIDNVLEST